MLCLSHCSHCLGSALWVIPFRLSAVWVIFFIGILLVLSLLETTDNMAVWVRALCFMQCCNDLYQAPCSVSSATGRRSQARRVFDLPCVFANWTYRDQDGCLRCLLFAKFIKQSQLSLVMSCTADYEKYFDFTDPLPKQFYTWHECH